MNKYAHAQQKKKKKKDLQTLLPAFFTLYIIMRNAENQKSKFYFGHGQNVLQVNSNEL